MPGLVHQHPDFAFFGADDHRLPAQAADHIERIHRPAPQGQFECIFLHAALQGLLQLVGDLEEAVGRAQSPDALVRPFVIVVLHPERGAFHRLREAVELGALEELPQDRLPEALDLTQGHGMVGTGTDMFDAVLFHLPFEAGLTAPIGILAAVVGEHLPGHTILGDAPAVGLQHVLGRLAAVQAQGSDVTAVVVHEADQVGVASRQTEGHDVALPQLVGTGTLEEPGLGRVPNRLTFPLVHQPLFGQGLVDRALAGGDQEKPFEYVGDTSGTVLRMRLLHRHHLLPDAGGNPGFATAAGLDLQPLGAPLPIRPDPAADGGPADADLVGEQAGAVTLLKEELDHPQSKIDRVSPGPRPFLPPGGMLFLFR